jgi:hypothetical protein
MNFADFFYAISLALFAFGWTAGSIFVVLINLQKELPPKFVSFRALCCKAFIFCSITAFVLTTIISFTLPKPWWVAIIVALSLILSSAFSLVKFIKLNASKVKNKKNQTIFFVVFTVSFVLLILFQFIFRYSNFFK